MTTTFLLTVFVQAAGALLTTLIFWSFYRHYQKGYLRHWTWSWLAAFVMLINTAAGIAVRDILVPDWPVWAGFLAVSAVAGYFQLALLLFGTYELVTGRAVDRRFARRLFPVLAVVGVVSALAFVTVPEAVGARAFSRVGIRAFFAGCAFLIAARGVWQARGASRGIGHRLVGVAFFIYGLEQFHYFGIATAALFINALPSYTVYLSLLDFLLQFAMTLGLVIWLLEDERKTAMDAAAQIQHLAYHDTLTGLPNRQLFLDRLDQAIAHAHRAGHQLAVFFFDLDRFKVINDSLGHSTGDALLQVVATRMRELLREEDTVTRLGGDEFTILAPRVPHVEDAVTIARKVRDTIRQPIVIDGRELFVTGSIGISVYPSDGDDAETLLKNADTAMYRAKTQGRDTFQLYAPAMNARALEQLALENSLRRALANDELEVFYQPINCTSSGRIRAVEAVLRWRHPQLGLLLPADFIALSETTGVIVPVGEWVLRTACRQAVRWHALHPELRVAVNLSVRQLQQPDFVGTVSQILAESGLPASALELEITESIAMQSDDLAITKLRELKRLGVRISIDDFGTGYSSLSVLRLFPADALKIDRSFVRDITHDADDAAIAESVIALAHTLKLIVIAEGVETEEQLRFLADRRCDFWQGYLHGEPMPAATCERLLVEQERAGPARAREAVLPQAPAPIGKPV